MKRHRQLLQIKWHQFIRNVEISATTGLLSISETISRCHNNLFGHEDGVPAHKALSSQINLSLGRPPNSQWSRRPGRPRNRWVDQIRRDNNLSPADLRRRAVHRGHVERRYGPCRLRVNNKDNALPKHVTSAPAVAVFRSRLKTNHVSHLVSHSCVIVHSPHGDTGCYGHSTRPCYLLIHLLTS